MKVNRTNLVKHLQLSPLILFFFSHCYRRLQSLNLRLPLRHVWSESTSCLMCWCLMIWERKLWRLEAQAVIEALTVVREVQRALYPPYSPRPTETTTRKRAHTRWCLCLLVMGWFRLETDRELSPHWHRRASDLCRMNLDPGHSSPSLGRSPGLLAWHLQLWSPAVLPHRRSQRWSALSSTSLRRRITMSWLLDTVRLD